MSDAQSFIWPIRVYYEDTDAGGVVYYANYLCFMERARSEWLRALGFEQDELASAQGVLFAVRSVSIDFLRPARFNQRLEVSVAVKKRGHASLVFSQDIRRAGELLCRAEVRVACLSVAGFEPRALPTALAERLQSVNEES